MQEKHTEDYIYPKEYFEKNEPDITEGLCFVIMPFNDNMNRIYGEVIAKAILDCGMIPIRADQIFDTKPIIISVMQKINEAEAVIADVTGRNPNVFYELGITHVQKENVILLAQNIEDVPFDLRHFRFIIYEDSPDGDLNLRETLKGTLFSIGAGKKSEVAVATVEEAATEDTGIWSSPELVSITIDFGEVTDWSTRKGVIFADLVNIVDFEQIEEKSISLTFPQGIIRSIGGRMELTLRPGDLTIEKLIESIDEDYENVEYALNIPFDIGDLVNRSRGGVRDIDSISKDSIVFNLRSKAYSTLTVRNTGTGSSVSISSWSALHRFSSDKPFIPLGVILKYLQINPPTEELTETILAAQ